MKTTIRKKRVAKPRKPRPAINGYADWVGMRLFIYTPIRVVSEANQREHHMATYRRKKQQQVVMRAWLNRARTMVPPDAVPREVQFTRYGGKRMDNDNLAGAFKHVRDEVARWFGVDDGDASVKWCEPAQEIHKADGIAVSISYTAV